VIVLDTHILIWYALDDESLHHGLRRRMESAPARVFVPTICIWEAVLLADKGRIEFKGGDSGAKVRGLIEQAGFVEAPLTGEIAVLSRTLKFTHDDPADRFIGATAYAMGAKLATSDNRLRQLPWIQLAY
jgi:PIN domain nuclease of toxin-antitoxin system